jgi:hypothetical protein
MFDIFPLHTHLPRSFSTSFHSHGAWDTYTTPVQVTWFANPRALRGPFGLSSPHFDALAVIRITAWIAELTVLNLLTVARSPSPVARRA